MTPARTYQGETQSVCLRKRELMSHINHTVVVVFFVVKLTALYGIQNLELSISGIF